MTNENMWYIKTNFIIINISFIAGCVWKFITNETPS